MGPEKLISGSSAINSLARSVSICFNGAGEINLRKSADQKAVTKPHRGFNGAGEINLRKFQEVVWKARQVNQASMGPEKLISGSIGANHHRL